MAAATDAVSRVAAAVVTYGSGATIGRCLDSILAQTRRELRTSSRWARQFWAQSRASGAGGSRTLAPPWRYRVEGLLFHLAEGALRGARPWAGEELLLVAGKR